jgi:lipopolysaccharide/colanic/teichoic acid biosynthesis glycosyltransferase
VIYKPITFEGGACMSLESNKSVARVAQATIQDEVVPIIGLDQWTKRVVDIILATMGLILFAPILLLAFLALSLDSGGPIFIRKTLLGVTIKRFEFLDFECS